MQKILIFSGQFGISLNQRRRRAAPVFLPTAVSPMNLIAHFSLLPAFSFPRFSRQKLRLSGPRVLGWSLAGGIVQKVQMDQISIIKEKRHYFSEGYLIRFFLIIDGVPQPRRSTICSEAWKRQKGPRNGSFIILILKLKKPSCPRLTELKAAAEETL